MLENSLKENIGLRYSEDSFDIINLNNFLNNNKVVFESENQLEVTFDNQKHQEQVKNRGQLKEISDTQDHHVIINQNANSNKVQKLQLGFKYPILLTFNKNVRKLKWISNYKENFKEFFKNTTLKLKSKDCYNKFNIMNISKRGDKTWPIKKPNKNKIERDRHTRICNAIKMNKIISYSIIEKSKDNIVTNNNTIFLI